MAQIQSLVEELRCYKLLSAGKEKKKKIHIYGNKFLDAQEEKCSFNKREKSKVLILLY